MAEFPAEIVFHKAHHSDESFKLVRRALNGECSVVFVSPNLKSIDHISGLLPQARFSFTGEWGEIPNLKSGTQDFDFSIGVFTSGTTASDPKLVFLSRENITSSIDSIFKFFDEIEVQAVFSYPQPYHVFGAVLGYALSIHKGWPLYFSEGAYSHHAHENWLEVARNCKGLITMGTPTHFKDLHKYLSDTDAVPPATLTSIAGGALVDQATWDLMKQDLKIAYPSIGYGCTEAAPGVTHLKPGRRPKRDGHLGKALDSLVVNPIKGRGLEISGANLCVAQIDQGLLTFPKKHIVPDELVLGDDGDFYYKGRLNLVINRGGEKIPIEAIESKLRSEFPYEFACFPVPDLRLGEDLGVAVCVKDLSPENFDNILENVMEKLGETYHRSVLKKNILLLETLPFNSNSKVDRTALTKLADKSSNRISPN